MIVILVYIFLASLFIKKDSYILHKNKNIYISLNLNFVSLAIYLPLLLNKKTKCHSFPEQKPSR